MLRRWTKSSKVYLLSSREVNIESDASGEQIMGNVNHSLIEFNVRYLSWCPLTIIIMNSIFMVISWIEEKKFCSLRMFFFSKNCKLNCNMSKPYVLFEFYIYLVILNTQTGESTDLVNTIFWNNFEIFLYIIIFLHNSAVLNHSISTLANTIWWIWAFEIDSWNRSPLYTMWQKNMKKKFLYWSITKIEFKR